MAFSTAVLKLYIIFRVFSCAYLGGGNLLTIFTKYMLDNYTTEISNCNQKLIWACLSMDITSLTNKIEE